MLKVSIRSTSAIYFFGEIRTIFYFYSFLSRTMNAMVFSIYNIKNKENLTNKQIEIYLCNENIAGSNKQMDELV